MPDSTFPPPQRVPAREALAALPLEQPQRSAWPALAERLRSPRRRRPALWWAVAASAVLVAILVPRLAPPDAGPASAPPSASDTHALHDPAGLEALQQQSRALESSIRGVSPALRSGSAVLAGEWIAADIGAIDAALAATPPEESAALWQARVVLLAELAGLRQHEAVTASGGGGTLLALD